MTRTTKEWQNILDKTPPYVAKEFTGGSIGSLAQKLIRERERKLWRRLFDSGQDWRG